MKERIYLDNAATTPMLPEVIEDMLPYFNTHFGNPSSIYSYGREARIGIEKSRKLIAKHLNCQPNELIFTSGGTESINTAIYSAVNYLGCQRIITTKIEHHAVIHAIEYLALKKGIELIHLNLNEKGVIDYDQLVESLKSNQLKTLVCLMHANNEIGNLLRLKYVSEICEEYKAVLMTDTVQTVGHYPIDLQHLKADFITAAPHKFHGPKGVGLLYVHQNIDAPLYLYGGGQEKNHRAGTENVPGIVGFGKALDLAMKDYEKNSQYIFNLKKYCHDQLLQNFPFLKINGLGLENTLYSVLNLSIPKSKNAESIIYNLDIENICVSSGSACSSGATVSSHVISGIDPKNDGTNLRISFSHLNTISEIDSLIAVLKKYI